MTAALVPHEEAWPRTVAGVQGQEGKREDGFVCGTDGSGWQIGVGSRKMGSRSLGSSYRVVGCKKRVFMFVSEGANCLHPIPQHPRPVLTRNTPQREHMCCYF